MPDTLAHFGVQIIASNALFRKADARWIGLGCLLPDLPWIAQRAALALGWADPVSLRLYAIIQSSLLFSLLLAAALSLQTASSRRIFLLLALLGLLLFPAAAWLYRCQDLRLIRSRRRQSAGLFLLLAYFLLPFALFSGPLAADNHCAATLLAENRRGSWIEFDRRPYQAKEQSLLSYSGEPLRLTVPCGSLPQRARPALVDWDFFVRRCLSSLSKRLFPSSSTAPSLAAHFPFDSSTTAG